MMIKIHGDISRQWKVAMDKVIERASLVAERVNEEISSNIENEATTNFSNAIYDGNNDVTVRRKMKRYRSKRRFGSVVIAEGKATNFIEFGTGCTYEQGHEWDSKVPFPTQAGSFGWGQGSNRHGWTYEGQRGTNGILVAKTLSGSRYRTYGNPANRCLLNAVKDTQNDLVNIARSVKK